MQASALLLPVQTAVETEAKVWQQAVKDGDAFGAAIACKLLEADHYRARLHAYYVAHLKASMTQLHSLPGCTTHSWALPPPVVRQRLMQRHQLNCSL